jgi:hypothetical protein
VDILTIKTHLTSRKYLLYYKNNLKSIYMHMHWPGDTKLAFNVARKAKRVAHPYSKARGLPFFKTNAVDY